ADALGARTEDAIGLHDAERERVHQDVVVVAGIESDLAADGRDADAVTVVADAADDAAHEVRRPRVRDAPEPQRVQVRNRPGAHREDVAENAADAGCRALKRLDERRMVVALDREHDGEPVPDVDRAGVLPGPLEDTWPGRR